MKREIDIEKIGRKMPHKAPSEEFFAEFKTHMLEQVAQKDKKAKVLKLKIIAPIITIAAAAALMIGIFVAETLPQRAEPNIDSTQLLSENIDESIDSFLGSLSDDELAYLVSNSSTQDNFYDTLPTY